MGLVNTNKIETNKIELEISVDAVSFAKAVDTAFKKNVHKMNVPGFRQGKAPRSIVEKLYGEGVFYEDAVNAAYPQAFEEAVVEAGIEPVDKAKIEVVTVGKEGLVFKAVVTVKPEVTIGEYKGLSVEKIVKNVSDEDINAEIEKLRQKNSRMISIEDRVTQNGDIAVFDFEGFVDETTFEGGKAEKHSLELGSGQFIPGFEDQIIGHSIGDEFDVNVTFPQEYNVPELAGKPAVFKIKLHEIKNKELPELDDEFAKDVSEFDTLGELKASTSKKLQEAIDKAATEKAENDLIDLVITDFSGEIPEVMIEHRIDQTVQDFDYRLQMQGMDLSKYLEYTNMDNVSFRKTFREQSEKQVKIRLALEKIVKFENIVPTQEEIYAEYENVSKKYNFEISKIKEHIPDSDFVMDIAVNKAIDLVKETAKINEVNDIEIKTNEESPKKAAKPRASKKAKDETDK
jgi:trigger factor